MTIFWTLYDFKVLLVKSSIRAPVAYDLFPKLDL